MDCKIINKFKKTEKLTLLNYVKLYNVMWNCENNYATRILFFSQCDCVVLVIYLILAKVERKCGFWIIFFFYMNLCVRSKRKRFWSIFFFVVFCVVAFTTTSRHINCRIRDINFIFTIFNMKMKKKNINLFFCDRLFDDFIPSSSFDHLICKHKQTIKSNNWIGFYDVKI